MIRTSLTEFKKCLSFLPSSHWLIFSSILSVFVSFFHSFFCFVPSFLSSLLPWRPFFFLIPSNAAISTSFHFLTFLPCVTILLFLPSFHSFFSFLLFIPYSRPSFFSFLSSFFSFFFFLIPVLPSFLPSFLFFLLFLFFLSYSQGVLICSNSRNCCSERTRCRCESHWWPHWVRYISYCTASYLSIIFSTFSLILMDSREIN